MTVESIALNIASAFCGVAYFTLFGTSLAFQVVVNYRKKSCLGFSTDYALVGFVGFFFLLLN